MSLDPSMIVRGAILTALKADSALGLITTRHYPKKTPANPAFPFTRTEVNTNTPIRPSGSTGGVVSGAVHCFTKLGATVVDPESQCAAINSRVTEILHGMDEVYVSQSQIIMDADEPDCFHGFVSFDATVIDRP